METVTCGQPRAPELAPYLEKLHERRQPWRKTLKDCEEDARRMRAQEILDDEDGEWALTVPDDEEKKGAA